jgi:hypothetical protein
MPGGHRARQPDEHQVEHPYRHKLVMLPAKRRAPQENQQVNGLCTVLEPYTVLSVPHQPLGGFGLLASLLYRSSELNSCGGQWSHAVSVKHPPLLAGPSDRHVLILYGPG